MFYLSRSSGSVDYIHQIQDFKDKIFWMGNILRNLKLNYERRRGNRRAAKKIKCIKSLISITWHTYTAGNVPIRWEKSLYMQAESGNCGHTQSDRSDNR